MGSVERERDEPLLGELLGVQAGGLLLHATTGVDGDDRGIAARLVEAVGQIQVPGHLDGPVVKLDVAHVSHVCPFGGSFGISTTATISRN